eukprot:GAHX01002621.1.p1 GENE.GAHX01002621.1~~GAHX01002621.1.p1  ORF type:complete len:340 (+),score=70.30 GAHX01002621.1:293-1312(+)
MSNSIEKLFLALLIQITICVDTHIPSDQLDESIKTIKMRCVIQNEASPETNDSDHKKTLHYFLHEVTFLLNLNNSSNPVNTRNRRNAILACDGVDHNPITLNISFDNSSKESDDLNLGKIMLSEGKFEDDMNLEETDYVTVKVSNSQEERTIFLNYKHTIKSFDTGIILAKNFVLDDACFLFNSVYLTLEMEINITELYNGKQNIYNIEKNEKNNDTYFYVLSSAGANESESKHYGIDKHIEEVEKGNGEYNDFCKTIFEIDDNSKEKNAGNFVRFETKEKNCGQKKYTLQYMRDNEERKEPKIVDTQRRSEKNEIETKVRFYLDKFGTPSETINYDTL